VGETDVADTYVYRFDDRAQAERLSERLDELERRRPYDGGPTGGARLLDLEEASDFGDVAALEVEVTEWEAFRA
jgi:hypothetical protein